MNCEVERLDALGGKQSRLKLTQLSNRGDVKIGLLFVNDKTDMFKSMESYVLMIWSLYFMTHDQ